MSVELSVLSGIFVITHLASPSLMLTNAQGVVVKTKYKEVAPTWELTIEKYGECLVSIQR